MKYSSPTFPNTNVRLIDATDPVEISSTATEEIPSDSKCLLDVFPSNIFKFNIAQLPSVDELSDAAIKALKGRKACLLANHGTITCGKNLDEAMFLTEEFEILCKQITIAKINGKPKLVEKIHMKKIIEAIKMYGKY